MGDCDAMLAELEGLTAEAAIPSPLSSSSRGGGGGGHADGRGWG